MKRWFGILLGIVISAATLAYALHGNDLNQLGGEIARGRYLYVIPCVILVIIGFFFRTLRWRSLLNERITFGHSFHILNISYFLNAWLPFRLGEVGRAFLTTRLRPPISMFTSLSTIVVERLTDLLAVVVVMMLALSMNISSSEVTTAAKATGILAIGGILALAVFASRRSLAHALLDLILRITPFLQRFNLRRFADHILDGIAPLGSIRGFSTALLWTALAWACSVIAGFFLMYAYYDTPTWSAALLMIASASIAVALPAVPGNVGPFEAATVAGLTIAGLVDKTTNPQERATAFAVLLHATVVITYTILGLIGLGQEKISLGELIRSAQQRAGKSKEAAAEPVEPTPITQVSNPTQL